VAHATSAVVASAPGNAFLDCSECAPEFLGPVAVAEFQPGGHREHRLVGDRSAAHPIESNEQKGSPTALPGPNIRFTLR